MADNTGKTDNWAKGEQPVCQCRWGVALPCLRSHARQIAIVSSPRPECVITITRATLAASDLRVLCSGSPSGVAALGNKKYTANSFLFICSSPPFLFFSSLSLLFLFLFHSPLSSFSPSVYLLIPSQASHCCCLDWLLLHVLIAVISLHRESLHHDLYKARAHGCAGKSRLYPP